MIGKLLKHGMQYSGTRTRRSLPIPDRAECARPIRVKHAVCHCLLGIITALPFVDAHADDSAKKFRESGHEENLELRLEYGGSAAPGNVAFASRRIASSLRKTARMARQETGDSGRTYRVSKGVADELSRKLDLDRLAALAILAHPSVGSKLAELEAARLGVDAARWNFYPSPSISKGLSGKRSKSDTTVVSIQQPLWTGGYLSASLDAAAARQEAADVGISEARYKVALRVAAAYRSWMVARGRSEAFANGALLLESYVESMKRRVATGVSAEVDLELVGSRLSQMNSDLALARASERAALAQLSQLVGRELRGEDVVIQRKSAETPPPLQTVVEQALASYPLLRRLERDIEAAQYDVSAKRASLFPGLKLRADHQVTRERGEDTQRDNRIMVYFEYTPGAGLSASAGADAAQAKVAGLRAEREAASRELTESISADFEALSAAFIQKQNLAHTRKASESILDSYDRLYVAGKRSWLDVLNAARELTQIETALVDAEATLAVTSYRLRLFQGAINWTGEIPDRL